MTIFRFEPSRGTTPAVGHRLQDQRCVGAASADGPVAPAASRGYQAVPGWQWTVVWTAVLVDACAITIPIAVMVLSNVFHTATRPWSLLLASLLPGLWLAAMNLSRAHEPRFLTLGSEEYRRVFDAAIRVMALVAILSFAFDAQLSRGLVMVGLPAAAALDLAGRYCLRKAVHRMRRRGRCVHRVLLVGHLLAVMELAETLRQAEYAGLDVVGCCLDVPSDSIPGRAADIPVFGGLGDVLSVVEREGITAIAATSSPDLDGDWLRRLAWRLEDTGVDVMVAPNLTDCAGPRIHIRPVAGIPLLHVEQPAMSGAHRLVKSLFDRSAASVALILLFPVLVAIGLTVRASSRGPALFRQARVGHGGKQFMLYKFRTMHTDAEQQLHEILEHNQHADGPLFKMRHDPRITSFGRLLRRYSLDELPQLLNVVRGDMSLVGPRPPLPSEVETYGYDACRRLLVRPGLTGLWQVSGRADLSWTESVRLDLFYVENWSLALDLTILWKTLPAVVRHQGAY